MAHCTKCRSILDDFEVITCNACNRKASEVFYKGVVKKYSKDADEYFQRCGVIPDTGDLAGCIFDFWSDESGIDLTDDDYKGLLTALGFDFDEDEDEDEETNAPPAFKYGPVPGQV